MSDQDPIVSVRELALRLGLNGRGLAYYYSKTKQIPAPHRLGDRPYYTQDEAQKIVEWWENRRKLKF